MDADPEPAELSLDWPKDVLVRVTINPKIQSKASRNVTVSHPLFEATRLFELYYPDPSAAARLPCNTERLQPTRASRLKEMVFLHQDCYGTTTAILNSCY